MNKVDPAIETIQHCFHFTLTGNKQRQSVVNKVGIALLLEGYTEEDAFDLFFWRLSVLEPPLTHEEQLFFRALCRAFKTCSDTRICSRERAFEILKIPVDKFSLPKKELLKTAKMLYWERFNVLCHDPKSLFKNAREIVLIIKAFHYISLSMQYK